MKVGQTWKVKPTGRRVEIAVGVVVVLCVSAALIYAAYAQDGPVTYTTTTLPPGFTPFEAPGMPCNGTLPASVEHVEQTSQFVQESGGSCYNYIGSGALQTNGSSFTQYTFDYYNGTVIYACGTSPSELVVSELRVTVPGDGSDVAHSSYLLVNDSSSLNVYEGCGPNLPPVGVVSAYLIVVTIPAIPELNLTLTAANSGQPITALSATVQTQGTNQTIAFTNVTPSSPLMPGQTVSVLGLLGAQGDLTPGVIYNASIQGEFADGSGFRYQVQIVPVNAA